METVLHTRLRSGSLLGGILLISGSCIGAGMLALPITTGSSGFFPSLLMFLLAWAFMAVSGQVLLAVNLKVGEGCSLISLAEKTLGRAGKSACWVLFLFLFYVLGVAYVSALGPIGQALLESLWGIRVAAGVCSVGATLLCAGIVFAGMRPVDLCNRLLMGGLIAAYLVLVFLGALYWQPKLLHHCAWKYAYSALPVLIVSFGFHNMIPSLATYFKGDVSRLRKVIWMGSFTPLVVYLVWQIIMLGILPQQEIQRALIAGEAATSALEGVMGKGWVAGAGNAFAFFAIMTSLLTQSLSLVDFLADGLRVGAQGIRRIGLLALALAPPLFCALIHPGLFLHALNMAGGIAAVALFGLLPACMARRLDKFSIEKLAPSWLVSALLISSSLLCGIQVLEECGFTILPRV